MEQLERKENGAFKGVTNEPKNDVEPSNNKYKVSRNARGETTRRKKGRTCRTSSHLLLSASWQIARSTTSKSLGRWSQTSHYKWSFWTRVTQKPLPRSAPMWFSKWGAPCNSSLRSTGMSFPWVMRICLEFTQRSYSTIWVWTPRLMRLLQRQEEHRHCYRSQPVTHSRIHTRDSLLGLAV